MNNHWFVRNNWVTYLTFIMVDPSCFAMSFKWSHDALHSLSSLFMFMESSSKSTLDALVTAPIWSYKRISAFVLTIHACEWASHERESTIPPSINQWNQEISPWPYGKDDAKASACEQYLSLLVPLPSTPFEILLPETNKSSCWSYSSGRQMALSMEGNARRKLYQMIFNPYYI